MRVSISGGAGFIGRHFIRALKQCCPGSTIKVLDCFSEQVHEPTSKRDFTAEFPHVQLRIGSVCDVADATWLVRDCDILVHLASETGTGQSMYDLGQYTLTNVAGTATLIEVLLKLNCKLDKLILTSSRSVYGEGAYGGCGTENCEVSREPVLRRTENLSAGKFNPICGSCDRNLVAKATAEDNVLAPASYYALTKKIQEDQFKLFKNQICSSLTIFRLQNVYGPGQCLTNPYTGILAIFSALAKQGQTINVFEDGEETRDFVHVRDVARCITAAVLDTSSSQFDNIINVGSGIPTTVLSIAEKINQYYGGRSRIKVSGDFRLGDIRHNFASKRRLQEAGIDTASFTDFDTGLLEFLTSIVSAPDDMENKLSASLSELSAAGMFLRGKFENGD